MIIYPAEQTAGISLTNKLTLSSVAMPSEKLELGGLDLPNFAKAREEQPDLHFIETLLVSVGWNLNDDVFLADEVFAAKDTPEDKPFNFQHNEKDIIGHIVANRVVDSLMNTVHGDPPEDFHIITSVAMYTHWEDEDLQDRMDGIIADIPKGKWFVSMEALFEDFDYAVINSKGEQSIIRREAATAHLTRHLRAYGGNGTYNNMKVGRLLRNLIFKGEGLVERPANPQSVIFGGKIDMSEKVDLQDQLTEAQSEIRKLTKELAESGVKAMKEEVTSLQENISGLEAQLEAARAESQEFKQKFEELNKSLEEKSKAHNEAIAELDSLKKDMKDAKRVNTLIHAGLTEKEATEKVKVMASADEATFNLFVEMVSALQKTTASTDSTEVVETVEEPEITEDETDTEVEVETHEEPNLSTSEEDSELALALEIQSYFNDNEEGK